MGNQESHQLTAARESARGGLVLFIGQFTSTLLSAVASFAIARILGPSSFGLYSLVFVIPNTILLLSGLGMYPAITRYAAYYRSQGRIDEAIQYTKHAVLVILAIGSLLTITNFLLAASLSVILLHRPVLIGYVQLGSLLILGQSLFSASFAAALGWKQMVTAGGTYFIQGGLKLFISVGLLVLGFGISGAVIGGAASYLGAGLLVMLFVYKRLLRGAKGAANSFIGDARVMLRYGLPLYAGSIIAGIGTYYVAILLATIATNLSIGFYQAASNVVTGISLVSGSIATALFPTFAGLYGIAADTKLAFRYATKYTALILAPLIGFVILSSDQLIVLFYGETYSSGSILLAFFALSFVPSIASNATTVFFNGVGSTRLTLVSTGVGQASLIALAPVFAIGLHMGMIGLVYSLVVSNFIAAGVSLGLAQLRLHATLDWRSILLVILTAAISAALTSLISREALSNTAVLILRLTVFCVLYSTLAPIFNALEVQDVNRLEGILGGILGGIHLISRPLTLVLRYEGFLARVVRDLAAKVTAPGEG